MTNLVLFDLSESGIGTPFPNIPTSSVFSKPLILQRLNEGILQLIKRANIPPSLVEKIVSGNVQAGADFILPADCYALDRVEYLVAGTTIPVPVEPVSFDEWDSNTGDNAAMNASGIPRMYREPYANTIRWNPQITLQAAINGDQTILYYRSRGLTLADYPDTPSLPIDFHNAPVYWALAMLAPRKLDASKVKMYLSLFEQEVKAARTWVWDINAGRDFQIEDAELTGEATLYADE